MDNEMTLYVNGWITVEKDQILLGRFNKETLSLEPVDSSQFTIQELRDAVARGDVYIQLTSMLEAGLCKSNDFEIEVDTLEVG